MDRRRPHRRQRKMVTCLRKSSDAARQALGGLGWKSHQRIRQRKERRDRMGSVLPEKVIGELRTDHGPVAHIFLRVGHLAFHFWQFIVSADEG